MHAPNALSHGAQRLGNIGCPVFVMILRAKSSPVRLLKDQSEHRFRSDEMVTARPANQASRLSQ